MLNGACIALLIMSVSLSGCNNRWEDIFAGNADYEGEIRNEVTLATIQLAEARNSDGHATKDIEEAKRLLKTINGVMVEYEKRKKDEGGSPVTNQELLNEIAISRAAMKYKELKNKVDVAMKSIRKI